SCGGHKHNFQAAWFKRFWWLEYSDKNDSTFCFPCYLFGRKPIGRVGSDTFTVKGFTRRRKVNSGKECPFINHEGKTFASAHNFSVRCYEDLKNKLCHIENVIVKQTEQEIIDNRLRLQVTIDSTKWLKLQTCPLRGGDERPTSLYRGNLLELVDLIGTYNKDVARVVSNAPQNAKYTSPDIQKEILQMYAMNVQEAIRDEIGNAKFCLIVDESQDESKKEQMAICVRFVDRKGYINERFLDLVHVKDTNALTLKNEILSSLYHLKLDVQDIRGQGYDGASNMHGEWNRLKALILNECPFAYYVHCFAHELEPEPSAKVMEYQSDGFTKVKKRKNKGRKSDQQPTSRHSGGVWFNNPKPSTYQPKKAPESAQCNSLKSNSNPFDALNTLGEQDNYGVPKPVCTNETSNDHLDRVASGVKSKSPTGGGKKNLVFSPKSKIHYFDSKGTVFDDLDQVVETADYGNG
ncbi:zinc finger MYM-type protein 1-like protein, partial [Tanacetum coccineum]